MPERGGRDHPGEVRYDRHGDASTPANHGREESRSAVLFVAAPLRIEGGTGSPLNPIAVL
jgi:hypothetical protein